VAHSHAGPIAIAVLLAPVVWLGTNYHEDLGGVLHIPIVVAVAWLPLVALDMAVRWLARRRAWRTGRCLVFAAGAIAWLALLAVIFES
jgi:hypothetical protein